MLKVSIPPNFLNFSLNSSARLKTSLETSKYSLSNSGLFKRVFGTTISSVVVSLLLLLVTKDLEATSPVSPESIIFVPLIKRATPDKPPRECPLPIPVEVFP